MDECKSPDPLVLLLNEIDILLTQMRLMELCVQQAQAKAKYERERTQQKHEAELAAVRYTLAESQCLPGDGSAEVSESKRRENPRTIEDELNQSRVSYQSQIENLQYEVAVRERALTERQEAVSAVELALHGKIQVLQQDLARLRSENASLREKTAQAEELRRQPGGDHQRESDLQKENGNLQTALSALQALQRNTEAKLDQLRLQLAEAQLIVESRAAENGHLKKELVALNQQLAQHASIERSFQNRPQAPLQNQDVSRFEIEQSLREELERLIQQAEEKSQILQTRNDELVTVKAARDALQERLNEILITTAEKENAALAELERMRSEFQAQLALLQAELSQKDWALQEREALSQSLEQNYRHETDSLRQLLEEEKARKVRATEEFTIGEIRLGPVGDVELASQIHDHPDASAQRRRWHSDFVWKRRWKASETK